MINLGEAPQRRAGRIERDRREHGLAWGITVVACLYCAWMGFHLWSGTSHFGALYEGMGAQLPSSTRVLIQNANWIYPVCFGGLMVALVAKELLVHDKRLSAMLTFLATIVAQFLAAWMTRTFYLPLFDLIEKLN